MEHAPFPQEQKHPVNSRRWAFLRRRNKEGAPPVLAEQAPVPRSTVSKFAHNIMGLLNGERPVETPRPAEVPTLEVPVNRARKWGRRVLDFVGLTEQKVEVSPPSPVRAENRRVIRDAKSDMQDAQQDLESAAAQPASAESSFTAPDIMKDIKQEVRRSVRSLRAEREKLQNAQPPSETAHAVTLGILAMIGGGLFMSAVEGRQVRKKIEKQEKTIKKQEVRIETLEQQLEEVKTPDRALVQRIGEFTHKQAALTREVAQEVRVQREQTPEVSAFFAEPRVQERKATFIIPEARKPELAQEQFMPITSGSSVATGGTGQMSGQQNNGEQPTKDQPAPGTKAKNKKPVTKDPVAGYVAVAVATAVAFALWFALTR